MARSRNIKPGFFKNEQLAELVFEDRILFQGLWCEADRDGRLEDRPRRIKAEVFPYDSVDVDAALSRLEKAGFVIRYVADGRKCIEVVNFGKHQNPHKKEAPSALPPRSVVIPASAPEIPVLAPEEPEPAGLIPDSLIPDSLIPEEEQKQERVQPMAARSRFAEFWSAYPNKKSKQEAEKSWRKQKLDDRCDELLLHVALMAASDDDWKRGYVPMGSTYLNQARWEDVPKRPPDSGPQAGQPMGKQMQGVMALEELKNGARQRLAAGGSGDGAAKAVLLVAGPDSGG